MSTKGQLIKLDVNDAFARHAQIVSMQTKEYNDWIKDCAHNEKFFKAGDNQWTEEELETLEKRGGYKVTMDMTRKAILSIVGMLTANKPDIKAIPVDNGDQAKAKIRNYMLKQTWEDFDGLLTTREIAVNAYRSNIAYAFVYPFRNRVAFKMLTYKEVIVEPSSTDPLFKDADSITIKKWIPIEKVKILYGIDNIINSNPYDTNTLDFDMKLPNHRIFDDTKKYICLYETYRKLPVRQENGMFRDSIVREILIGYEHMFRDVLPPEITEYPIIPLYAEFSSNPYKLSEMHYMKDPQRFINKMYNITIMNAQATGSPKVFVHSVDIPNEDIDEFSNNYAIPGSINELNPGAEAPIVVPAQPLSNAFFSLYQDATQYLFRIYSSLGLDGSPVDSSQNMPDVTLHERREAVMDSLKIIAGIYEAFLKQLGKCILEAWSAYVSEDEVVKCCKANDILEQVKNDQKDGLDVRDQSNVQKWMETMQKKGLDPQEIQQHVEEAMERADYVDSIFDTLMGIGDIEYDIRITPESYAPTYQASKFNTAIKLAEVGAVDPETLLQLAPLDDKDDIMKRVSLTRQLQAQAEQLTQQVEELTKELKSKDNQLTEALRKVDLVKHETDLYKVGVDERYKVKDNVKNERLQTVDKQRQLDYAIKELMLLLKNMKTEDLEKVLMPNMQDAIRII